MTRKVSFYSLADFWGGLSAPPRDDGPQCALTPFYAHQIQWWRAYCLSYEQYPIIYDPTNDGQTASPINLLVLFYPIIEAAAAAAADERSTIKVSGKADKAINTFCTFFILFRFSLIWITNVPLQICCLWTKIDGQIELFFFICFLVLVGVYLHHSVLL